MRAGSLVEKTAWNGLNNAIGSWSEKPGTVWTFFCHISVAVYIYMQYAMPQNMMKIRNGMCGHCMNIRTKYKTYKHWNGSVICGKESIGTFK